MNVLLFGPPGSGKGTQAADLASRLKIPHVATGDIFRKNLRDGTALGRLARSYMDKGNLVPDSVTCDMVADRLLQADAASGALLDGFPRTVPQAEWLLAWLGERSGRIDVVISLLADNSIIVDRVTGRRSCMNCGATYHVRNAPPNADGTCTKCGAAVLQRKDDQEDVVVTRLETYARDTAPILAALRGRSTIYDIDGVGEIAVVQARIRSAMSLG